MQGQFCEIHAFELESFAELLAKMQAGSRGRNRTFVLGEDGLEALLVGGLHVALDVLREWGLAQLVYTLLELLVGAVKQETQCTSARGGVVDDLGHQLVVLTEVELVSNTDFTRRIDQHVPQQAFAVQLTQQEHLDGSTGLFLVAVEACRENLGVVCDQYITLIEVAQNVPKVVVLNRAFGTVDDHHTRVGAIFGGVLSDELGRDFESEL